MNTEWAQKLTKERVMKQIQDIVRKAYRSPQPKAEIVLPREIHQIVTTIKLK